MAQIDEAKRNIAESQQKIAELTSKIQELERDITVKSWNVDSEFDADNQNNFLFSIKLTIF